MKHLKRVEVNVSKPNMCEKCSVILLYILNFDMVIWHNNVGLTVKFAQSQRLISCIVNPHLLGIGANFTRAKHELDMTWN